MLRKTIYVGLLVVQNPLHAGRYFDLVGIKFILSKLLQKRP